MVSEDFNKWLHKAIEMRFQGRRDPHNVFPHIDLTDAKLAFIDGESAEEYSKTIQQLW